MKRSPTLFLQAIIVLIAVGALTFLLWEPHLEGRNVGATPFQIYFNDPFLAYAYTGSNGTAPELRRCGNFQRPSRPNSFKELGHLPSGEFRSLHQRVLMEASELGPFGHEHIALLVDRGAVGGIAHALSPLVGG